MYHIKNNHEPIVDRKIFDIVQEILNSRGEKRKYINMENGKNTLFIVKIKCDICEKKYNSKSLLKGEKYERKNTWRCIDRSKYLKNVNHHSINEKIHPNWNIIKLDDWYLKLK